MASVFFSDEQDAEPVDAQALAALARAVLDEESVPPDVEVAIILVDVAAMTELNGRFMGHEGPTDVLSFPIDELGVEPGRWPDGASSGPARRSVPDDEVPFVLGDIVLCPSVARAQAERHSLPLEAELSMLTVHGLLHLLGMDHANPADAAVMFEAQHAHLTRLGIPSPGPAAWM